MPSNHVPLEALLTGDLVPHVLGVLTDVERRALRLVSQSARRGVDKHCARLNFSSHVQGPERELPASVVWDTLSSARGFVLRGCRPICVTIDICGDDASAPARRQLAELILGKLEETASRSSQLSRASSGTAGEGTSCSLPVLPPGLPTRVLRIGADLLTPQVAQAAAAAFPQLTKIKLLHCDAPMVDVAGLADLLLGSTGASSPGSAGTSRGGDGGGGAEPSCSGQRAGGSSGGGSSAAALAPRVDCISLEGQAGVPQALLQTLAACPRLRCASVQLHALTPASGQSGLSLLRSLSQLRQLKVSACPAAMAGMGWPPSWRTPLALPTGLTRLRISLGRQGVLSPELFAPLAALRDLDLQEVLLQGQGMDALTALTSLQLHDFAASSDPLAPPPNEAPAEWPLPPNLQRLVVQRCTTHAWQLAALVQPSRKLQLVDFPALGSEPVGDLQVCFSTRSTKMQPRDASCLRRAWQFLALWQPPSLRALELHLHRELPLGEGCGHAEWLEALGRVRAARVLSLRGLALDAGDVAALALHLTAVQRLFLVRCELPFVELPCLARLPALTHLTLDLGKFEEFGNVVVPEYASPGLLELCIAGERGALRRVVLRACVVSRRPLIEPWRALVAGLHARMQREGMDASVLELRVSLGHGGAGEFAVLAGGNGGGGAAVASSAGA